MQLELKALQRKIGITFVYVTHDQGEALALSDRIAVMNEGRILQVGTPSEIYDSPQNCFVADFIGTSNFFEGTLISTDGDLVRVESNTEPTFKFVCPHSEGMPIDTPVTVMIRPERINISAEPNPDVPNCLHGVIEDQKLSRNDSAIHGAN